MREPLTIVTEETATCRIALVNGIRSLVHSLMTLIAART